MGGSFARSVSPQGVGSANYNAANQQLGFGSQTLTYDLNGNLTSDGTNSYTWDARNRLTAINGPAITATFSYDFVGRRTSKTLNGVNTTFLYDAFDVVREQSATMAASVLTGGLDEVFLRDDTAGTWSFLKDGLGSSLSLSDAAGTSQTDYSYTAFGQTASSGTESSNSSQYTGRENDGTGLQFNRARYYSPTLQRFISEDPLGFRGGDINIYAYARNNPLMFSDPFGQTTLQIGLGGTAIYGIAGVTGSFGIVIDGSGNVGWYTEGGGGAALGAKASAGVIIHGSTGSDITKLAGPFNNASIGGGKVIAGSIDGFMGNTDGENVFGGGVTLGGGGGGGVTDFITDTHIHPLFNLGDLFGRGCEPAPGPPLPPSQPLPPGYPPAQPNPVPTPSGYPGPIPKPGPAPLR